MQVEGTSGSEDDKVLPSTEEYPQPVQGSGGCDVDENVVVESRLIEDCGELGDCNDKCTAENGRHIQAADVFLDEKRRIERTLEMIDSATLNIDKLITAQMVKISKLQSKLLSRLSPKHDKAREIPVEHTLPSPVNSVHAGAVENLDHVTNLRAKLQFILELGSDFPSR